jgi:hypothetical protein
MLQVAGLVGTAIVAVLAWSLRRNVKAADGTMARVEASVSAVATDVRQLASSVQAHDRSLAAGAVTISSHGERINGLESRERERGCFGPCPARAQGPRPTTVR